MIADSNPSIKTTVKIHLTGRVQGVNFRSTCRDLARQHNLTGTVENLPDGGVLIFAQGDDNQVRAFTQWLQRGSILSRVDTIRYDFLTEAENYSDFIIKRSGNFFSDQISAFKNLGQRLLARTKTPHLKNVNKLSEFKLDNLPQHLVIIPDGNRRWAKQRNWPAWRGHAAGVENVLSLAKLSRNLGIKYFTLWAFSTENWQRDSEEVNKLMKIFAETLKQEKPNFLADRVRFKHLGRRDRLPPTVLTALEDLELATAYFTLPGDKQISVALDYGGRDELIRATQKAVATGDLTEASINAALDTAGMPDPDLIIRTSGEQRLSGLMPWQAAYAELYFTAVHFPDFNQTELFAALEDFAQRQRRFGT